MKTGISMLFMLLATGSTALGQSLNERPAPVAPVATPPDRLATSDGAASAPVSAVTNVAPAADAGLRGVSLFAGQPPPRRGRTMKNDVVQIIINETSNRSRNRTLDTKKD